MDVTGLIKKIFTAMTEMKNQLKNRPTTVYTRYREYVKLIDIDLFSHEERYRYFEPVECIGRQYQEIPKK